MSDAKFINGLYVKDRNPNTPQFIIGSFSAKVEDLIACLRENVNSAGYVNFDMKKSQQGKIYFQINQWEPRQNPAQPPAQTQTGNANTQGGYGQSASDYVAQNPPPSNNAAAQPPSADQIPGF